VSATKTARRFEEVQVGVLSKFENGVDDAFDKAGAAVFKGPLQPAQIARRAEKQMRREKLVGAGKQYAPTLFTVLVSPKDDARLFAFYPTMAAEIETYLLSKGADQGLSFDGRPLVRFIVDKKLKSGKFDVIAETVSSVVINELRDEESDFYGLKPHSPAPESKAKESASPLNGRSLPEMANPATADALGYVSESELRAALRLINGGGAADDANAGAKIGGGAHYGQGALFGQTAGSGEGIPENADVVGNAGADAVGHAVGSAAVQPDEIARDAYARIEAASLPADFFYRTGRDPDDADRDPHSPAQGSSFLIDHSTGARHELSFVEMSIGRDEDNDIVINDANASRRHALIRQNCVGSWKIIDLESTNGTLLNDHPVDQMILRNDDELTIGVTVLEFKTASVY
jgi:hypothetical protein